MLQDKLKEVKHKVLELKYGNIITIVGDEDLIGDGVEILKRRFALSLRRYPKVGIYGSLINNEFWEQYANLSKEESKAINRIIVESILENKYTNPELVARRISREVGIPYKRALIIARTELANFANKAKEVAYRELTRVKKFRWVAEPDACERCKEVARRTAHGVTLDELKGIIKEVCGDSARELLCHPNCRCTFTRVYEKNLRWWER